MIQQDRVGFLLRFLIFVLVLSLLSGLLVGVGCYASPQISATGQLYDSAPITVVLDAGHGGEDGGAVGVSGVCEKDLNLSITLILRDLLVANGVNVVLTREDDRLLYDRNVNYHGRKKALDLAARKKIAEETPNAVFVSIHMNSYPQAQYKGLQVWYSPNEARSEEIATRVQERVAANMQPENGRSIKRATSSIYLLHRLQIPAILIECGFLSNAEDCARLEDPAYQRQLALQIMLALCETTAPPN